MPSGPRSAPTNRQWLKCPPRCKRLEMTADQARRVGELAGRADHEDVVDVAVVEGAARRDDDVILTSNETHVRQVLLKATGKRIRIETV
jgi:hypothetical protein